MAYIISFTLLVALSAWLVSTYLRLYHLYTRVQGAWARWSAATHAINECLENFAQVFAAHLSSDDVLARDIRRWAGDSQRVLSAMPVAPMDAPQDNMKRVERHLRRAVSHSVHAVESSQLMRQDKRLQSMCDAMSVSLYKQDESARFYGFSASQYNVALRGPGAKIIASIFGFVPVLRKIP